jgi:hypothetical protein
MYHQKEYFKFNLAESIIIVVYLTSAKTTHTSTISVEPSAMASISFILFSISNIFILPIIMLVVGFRMELIKTPQKSSETLVNIADRCLQARKLGVGGNLRGLQLSNLVIRHLHIIIKSICVPLHLHFKMLYDAPGTWRLLQAMILLLGACHGEKNKDNKRTSEVVKSLQLIGCSYCKALTLNLLHKLLPILTLLPGGDGN